MIWGSLHVCSTRTPSIQCGDGHGNAVDSLPCDPQSLLLYNLYTVNSHGLRTGLIRPVRRLRRIAMAREGRMQAPFSQAVKIRDTIVDDSSNARELMREQLPGACRAALNVLNDASK